MGFSIKKLKINDDSEKIKVSLEDLDKQFEFYNQTLNQYEILNHNNTLKINTLQSENEKLKKENEKLRIDNEVLLKNNDKLHMILPSEAFKKGIDVLVPTYRAEKFILKFLDSMKKQTLDNELFEVIFVINGERDNTENLIKEFIQKNPEINIKIIESEPGATTARNEGIEELTREYVVFIDVDDFISPNYLNEAYKHCAPNRIVLGDYYDIDENTGELIENFYTKSLKGKKGIIDPYSITQGALLIATNKVMPTKDIKTVKFNTDLKSGDDHEYFCRLYSKYDYEFYFMGNDCNAAYYRLLVSNSVSRQPLSFDFNVVQRLIVIKEIDNLIETMENPKMKKILELAINSSQTSFIYAYLERYPADYPKVLEEIKKYKIKHFNLDKFKDNTISLLNKQIENNNDNGIFISNNNDSKNKEVIAQIKSIERKNQNIEDLKRQNEMLLNSNKELSSMNDKLLSSTSWKITKPLRKLKK